MDAIIKSLGFNWQIWLGEVILFVLLWNVMSRIFWKPILAHLQSRDQAIANAYASVEQTRHEMETLRSEYQSRITEIENDARAQIQNAIKEAQTERERIITEARQASDTAIREGLTAMEKEKEQAITDLQERMVGLAVNAASKALGPAANTATLRRSIEERIARGSNGADPARN